jgi:hypothetical protein
MLHKCSGFLTVIRQAKASLAVCAGVSSLRKPAGGKNQITV